MQNWNGKLDASIVEENVPIQFAAEFVKAIESDLRGSVVSKAMHAEKRYTWYWY